MIIPADRRRFLMPCLTGVAVAAPLVAVFAGSFLPLLNYAHDDSFFYIKTAFNFARGLGSTFDGVTVTNGYHPLWFFTLVLLYKVTLFAATPTPEFVYRLTFAASWLITASAFFIGASAFRRSVPGFSPRALAIAGIVALTFVAIRDIGTEAHVTCLLLALYMRTHADEASSDHAHLIRGLLLALVFLCRIEYLFTLIPVLLSYELRRSGSVRSATRLLLPLAVVGLAYFTSNRMFFGHFLTVSATVKNTFPHIVLVQNVTALASRQLNQGLRVGFILLVALVFASMRWRRHDVGGSSFSGLIVALLSGSLVFFLFHLLFNAEGIREWYPAGAVFVVAFALGWIADAAPKARNAVLTAAVIVFVAVFTLTRTGEGKWDSAYRYAKLLQSHTASTDRILQNDGSGVVGFFSQRAVVNGDGLISSFEYHASKTHGGLRSFLAAHDIRYYSTYSAVPKRTSDSTLIFIETAPGADTTLLRFTASELVLSAVFSYRHPLAPLHGEWRLFLFDH